MSPKILVIGPGNPLRQDDGIGSEVVKMLGNSMPLEMKKEVSLRTEHQVDLAQADLIKDYEKVIFIDAPASGENLPVIVKELFPEAQSPSFTSHIGSIPVLLSITERVFGKAPQCHLVAVKGGSFAFGTELSAESKKNAALGVKVVTDLVGKMIKK